MHLCTPNSQLPLSKLRVRLYKINLKCRIHPIKTTKKKFLKVQDQPYHPHKTMSTRAMLKQRLWYLLMTKQLTLHQIHNRYKHPKPLRSQPKTSTNLNRMLRSIRKDGQRMKITNKFIKDRQHKHTKMGIKTGNFLQKRTKRSCLMKKQYCQISITTLTKIFTS